MTNEAGPGHTVSGSSAQRNGSTNNLVLDTRWIVLAIGLLGAGGAGGGALTLANTSRLETTNLATKEQFNSLDAKLDVLSAKLDVASVDGAKEGAINETFRRATEKALADLESRVRALEGRRQQR